MPRLEACTALAQRKSGQDHGDATVLDHFCEAWQDAWEQQRADLVSKEQWATLRDLSKVRSSLRSTPQDTSTSIAQLEALLQHDFLSRWDVLLGALQRLKANTSSEDLSSSPAALSIDNSADASQPLTAPELAGAGGRQQALHMANGLTLALPCALPSIAL